MIRVIVNGVSGEVGIEVGIGDIGCDISGGWRSKV